MSTPDESSTKPVDAPVRLFLVIRILQGLAPSALIVGCCVVAWMLPAILFGVSLPEGSRSPFRSDAGNDLFSLLLIGVGLAAGWRRHWPISLVFIEVPIGLAIGQTLSQWMSPDIPLGLPSWSRTLGEAAYAAFDAFIVQSVREEYQATRHATSQKSHSPQPVGEM